MDAASTSNASQRRSSDVLPVGVIHMDASGVILFANEVVGGFVGVDPDELLGRNLFEFGTGDAARAGELLEFAGSSTGTLMGPVAASYVGADGSVRQTSMWARNHLDDPDVGAIVVVLLPEDARDSAAAALSSIAETADEETTFELLAASVRGHPFDCIGCWLVIDDDGNRLVGDQQLDIDIRTRLREPGPWWDALDNESLVEQADTSSGDGMDRALDRLGVKAWWLQTLTPPVDGLRAGLLVLRPRTGPASPNQIEHLAKLVTIARLALVQARMRASLSHAAFHDPLTGLPNRGRFFSRDDTTDKSSTAVLTIDLDHFKPVNDVLGHKAGDRVLVTVADRIRRAVRPSDHVARLGGDEFAVECSDVDQDRAGEIAERIISQVCRPIIVDGVQVHVGASVGIALGCGDETRAELLERSDAAMFEAKAAGRGRWRIAEPVRRRPD